MTPYIAYRVAGKLALSACKIGIIRDAKTANTRRYHYPPSAALSGTKPSATSARWSLLSSIATLFRRPGGGRQNLEGQASRRAREPPPLTWSIFGSRANFQREGEFRPCPASPQPRSLSSPASLGGAVRSHRRTWIPSSSAYGVKSSMRCPATGSTLPASSFSAVWSPRPRSRSDKRRGCVSCGPRIKTAERRPARLLLSMVCWPRTSLTSSPSCVLHLAHSCGLGQLAQR